MTRSIVPSVVKDVSTVTIKRTLRLEGDCFFKLKRNNLQETKSNEPSIADLFANRTFHELLLMGVNSTPRSDLYSNKFGNIKFDFSLFEAIDGHSQ